MDCDFDVIVIGGGAGGGTLAAELAVKGSRVLLLERGAPPGPLPADEQATLIEQRPYDDRQIHLNRNPARLYMGSGPGGGTSVYGAALLRPSVDDFHPGKHYSDRLPRHLWDWPLDYSELRPWYDRAEQLYRVASDQAELPSPLPCGVRQPHLQPLPLAPINQRVFQRSQQADLNPFRLPLAIESDRCLRCSHCAGFVCPTGARRGSGELVTEAVASGYPLTVLNRREVTDLVSHSDRISHVNVHNRNTGRSEQYRARRYVLSAGAIGTPCILQRSGFEHPELGRNYMMHYSPLVVGLFARRTAAERTFVKQLGYADFYFGTEELPEKMGIVQSLPAPGPLMLKKSGLSRVPTLLLNLLRRHMLPFVGIVEDLPNPSNRVQWTHGDRIMLHHQFSSYDRWRGDALSGAMCRILRSAGAVHCVSGHMPSQQHVAHQCGTVRFGSDARHAVADRDGRLFGHHDVFVADGSVLPTSLGVGPSLTLIANSLRIAQIIRREI